MNRQSAFIQLPSAPMQTIYKTTQQVVQSNIPLFITGETGVGKEGIARYIHETSPRRDKPFIGQRHSLVLSRRRGPGTSVS
jgi:DNA-binding NtrC family response regulator